MELTTQDVQEQQFHDAWRGYSQEEVDDFLDHVAETVERLTRENEALRARLNELDEAVGSAKATEEMLKQTLMTAQQTAEQSVAEAREQAEKLMAEAEQRVQNAEEEVRRRVEEAEEQRRRRTEEIEDRFEVQKSELSSSLERLQAFEGDIKRRLRAFLEQQLEALGSLGDGPTPTGVGGSPTESEAAPRAEVVVEEIATPESSAEAEVVDEVHDEEEPVDPAATVEAIRTMFDSLPADEEQDAALDEFKPFDDDQAALQGRRRRGLFRRRVDDWA